MFVGVAGVEAGRGGEVIPVAGGGEWVAIGEVGSVCREEAAAVVVVIWIVDCEFLVKTGLQRPVAGAGGAAADSEGRSGGLGCISGEEAASGVESVEVDVGLRSCWNRREDGRVL